MKRIYKKCYIENETFFVDSDTQQKSIVIPLKSDIFNSTYTLVLTKECAKDIIDIINNALNTIHKNKN